MWAVRYSMLIYAVKCSSGLRNHFLYKNINTKKGNSRNAFKKNQKLQISSG